VISGFSLFSNAQGCTRVCILFGYPGDGINGVRKSPTDFDMPVVALIPTDSARRAFLLGSARLEPATKCPRSKLLRKSMIDSPTLPTNDDVEVSRRNTFGQVSIGPVGDDVVGLGPAEIAAFDRASAVIALSMRCRRKGTI
jgi:hypothetical protein